MPSGPQRQVARPRPCLPNVRRAVSQGPGHGASRDGRRRGGATLRRQSGRRLWRLGDGFAGRPWARRGPVLRRSCRWARRGARHACVRRRRRYGRGASFRASRSTGRLGRWFCDVGERRRCRRPAPLQARQALGVDGLSRRPGTVGGALGRWRGRRLGCDAGRIVRHRRPCRFDPRLVDGCAVCQVWPFERHVRVRRGHAKANGGSLGEGGRLGDLRANQQLDGVVPGAHADRSEVAIRPTQGARRRIAYRLQAERCRAVQSVDSTQLDDREAAGRLAGMGQHIDTLNFHLDPLSANARPAQFGATVNWRRQRNRAADAMCRDARLVAVLDSRSRDAP